MPRPAIAVLVLAACAGAPARSDDPLPDQAPAVPCTPALIDIGGGVVMPTVMLGLLGPDPRVETWTITARASGGSRELRWQATASADPAWFAQHAAAALERATGSPPEVEDDALVSAWMDGLATHTLGARAGELDYRCAVTGITPMRADELSGLSPQLDPAWVDAAVRARVAERPAERVWIDAREAKRTYGWELVEDPDADRVVITFAE